MKKLFVLPLLALALVSCKDEEPALPPLTTPHYNSKLTANNSTLIGTESTAITNVGIRSQEKDDVEYIFTISEGSYTKLGTEVMEIILQGEGYIKSASTYYVSRIILDFWGKKGANFQVLANGEEKVAHDSSITPMDYKDDGAMVKEFEINSTSWEIKNIASTNKKTSIYGLTVVYQI